MIINDLMGGLGNQLFQISAGFAHAKNVQTDFPKTGGQHP